MTQEKETYVWLFILCLSLFFLGRWTAPDTTKKVVVASITSTSSALTITNYVYILAERKECDEWGGIFSVGWELTKDVGLTFQKEENISCTKSYTEGNKEIKETLFNYEF